MNETLAETVATSPPVAVVRGQSVTTLPVDLYIPPEALRVFLEAFEGPLDLLLYLIKRENLDILDIPIAEITRQYVSYVELMHEFHLELAGEYLVMAAMLAEIKSRMLLPKPEALTEEEADPRAELIRRLQEYECFKKAASTLDELPREGRDVFNAQIEPPEATHEKPKPKVELKDLLLALQEVLQRTQRHAHHEIPKDTLSVRERMSQILQVLGERKFTEFTSLFEPTEGRLGVVVTFLSILELVREALIDIIQNEPFSPIHVKLIAE